VGACEEEAFGLEGLKSPYVGGAEGRSSLGHVRDVGVGEVDDGSLLHISEWEFSPRDAACEFRRGSTRAWRTGASLPS